MIVYNINIEMKNGSEENNIPFEDEVSSGPSRRGNVNKHNGSDESDSDGDHGGRGTEHPPPHNKPSTSEQSVSTDSSSSESDTVKKIERTVAAMKTKLKKLSKKRKRSDPPRDPEPEPEPEPEARADAVNIVPVRKSRKINTATAVTAFAPRLRPGTQPLRRANDENQHLRSANDEHRRSANHQHLRSASEPSVAGEESEPGDDDAISLLDDENWPDDDDADPEAADDEAVEPAPVVVEADPDHEEDFEGLISALDFVTATEAAGPDINTAWAERLKGLWLEDNNLHSMKPLYEKYKIPANCESVCAPLMNPEMKRLLSTKWDKKTDITYSGMQKTLTKIFSATVELNGLNMGKTHTQSTKQQGMQITTDIVTMLGQLSYELSNQRKFLLGKVIQPQFRPLCSKETVKPTKYLFGENVTQLIKDVQVKNKIGYRDDARGSRGRPTGRGSFLGYGRGRSQGRAPRGRGFQRGYQHQYQNQGHQGHHKKKN